MFDIKIYILKKAIFRRFKTRKNKININYQLTTKNLLKWLKIPKNDTISNQQQHRKQQKNTKNRIFKGLRLKDVIMIMSKRRKRLFLDDLRHDYYKIV